MTSLDPCKTSCVAYGTCPCPSDNVWNLWGIIPLASATATKSDIGSWTRILASFDIWQQPEEELADLPLQVIIQKVEESCKWIHPERIWN